MNDDRTSSLSAQAEASFTEEVEAGAEPAKPARRRGRERGREVPEQAPRSAARLELEAAPEILPEPEHGGPTGNGNAAQGESLPEHAAPREDGTQDEGEDGVAAEVSDEELEREVAALLFASAEPLSCARLGGLLGEVPRARLERALEALGARLAASGLPYELREVAGGWQLFTSPDLCETVSALARVRRDERVSPAALETLAVIAYRQPVSKAEIEAIRGVQAGPILRALVDRGLVRVAGRSTDPGHALLYGTTRQFLDVFGLASIDDLPRDGELLRD